MITGSLCSGYGGLDTAVGAPAAWHAEVDPAASKVLAHRYPGVPNLGDITLINWSQVKPVDVLTAGFPCQDVSLAGARAGLRPGTRSGLWFHVARAIGDLRPPLVFLENVRGLLSAGADSDVEPCPWCLGDAGDQHALRALGAVLGDLADLGYDASWCGLRAADVGAPHGRYRIFVAAWPAHPDAAQVGRRASGWNDRVRAEGLVQNSAAHAEHRGEPEWTRATWGKAGERQTERRQPGGDSPDVAADTSHVGHERCRQPRERRSGSADGGFSAAHTNLDELPRERVQQPGRSATARSSGLVAADADSGGLGPDLVDLRAGQPDVDWGAYAPAIARWEAVLGRPAPAPTIRGTRGQPKLSPYFVEWMQGLDEGHVTAVPGLSTNDMLRLLGNGVVPQQGAAAFSWLLRSRGVAA